MSLSPFESSSFSDSAFAIMPLIVVLVFAIVFIIIIITLIKGVQQWGKNNQSPLLTVDTKVVTKRTDVNRHRHHNNNGMSSYHSSSTSYYVTFEVESGDRIEFLVSGSEYGMLVEGDTGKLTFQGTRYKGFKRYSH